MKHTLNVRETGNKAGRFHYWVTDETGKVLTERKSNREYVACTINGQFYFGRLDLIGKGDHGRQVKHNNNFKYENGKWVPGSTPQIPIAYLKQNIDQAVENKAWSEK